MNVNFLDFLLSLADTFFKKADTHRKTRVAGEKIVLRKKLSHCIATKHFNDDGGVLLP
jgi:hypothetical protein